MLRQMGMAPSEEQVDLVMGTVRGGGSAAGAQTGVTFWQFVSFFTHALASQQQRTASSTSAAAAAPLSPAVPAR